MLFMGTIRKRTRVAYSRILFNKTTATFFVFSFILCFAQGIMQSFLLSVDSDYKSFLQHIIQTVEPTIMFNLTFIPTEFHINKHTAIPLSTCNDVAIGEQRRREHCTVIFDTAQPIVPPSPTIVITNITFSDHAVVLNNTVDINEQCAQTLLFAYQNIRNFSSEDLALLALQFWLFVISSLAVTNESVAHLCTVLMTRVLLMAWSAYSIWRTTNYKTIFWKLYADVGTPCHTDFFSNYIYTRWAYEIPDLVLNVAGLLISCWLSWGILRIYSAQAMTYVGAPEHINRINKVSLAVLSCLQLEVFILTTAMGLWIDILYHTAIQKISEHTPVYLGGFIATTTILIPWICLGWYGIRREMKKTIALFFFLAFAIIVGWSIMFYSLVYRWTFVQWPFLACCSVASFILIVSSTILAIICRLNFNRGLKQYLEAEAALAKVGFSPEVFRHDEEKNTSFDLDIDDFKNLSPVSSRYEQPMPTYIVTQSQSESACPEGFYVAEDRAGSAQGAPTRVPRLAERVVVRMSVQSPPKYDVRMGEAF